jgi:protein-tyrosine phosphatase
MFSFFFKKKANYDFTSVGVDMHSHLVPFIDDGSKSLEESQALINGLFDLGFSHLITTPHTIKEIYPNTFQDIESGFARLDSLNVDKQKLQWSSEYFLDELFFEQLEEDKLKPLPGNRLLVEFSQISRPLDLEENLFKIAIRGYQPVLAHPERYLFFHEDLTDYSHLKDLNVEFQINALSLTGYYGRKILKISQELISRNWIDFMGTDTHHFKHLEALKEVPKTKLFKKLEESGQLKNKVLLAD